MSIRYSGDVEIRLRYDPKTRIYRGTVVDPYLRWRGTLPVPKEHASKPTDPLAYDTIALQLLHEAQRRARTHKRKFMVDSKNGRIRIRRVYQAPCPT